MSKPWWSKKWGKDKICPITYTRVRPGKNTNNTKYTTILPCKHYFCTSSLIEWIGNSYESTCPVCRTKFNISNIY